jgi:ribosomal protein L11 methyltransferase
VSWIELKLNIPPEKLDDISGYLFALGCEGINVTEKEIFLYYNTYNWTNEIQIALQEYISHVIPGFSMRYIQLKSVTEHDWNKDWKKFFKQIRISPRIQVHPPWEKVRPQEGEVFIIINPKMAFGTGHHESTQLILIELDKRISGGISVLDVGTGSGILAIAAEKLGAESIVAIDNDLTALKNAEENLRLNKCKRTRIYLAELDQMQPVEYDIVVANINKNVLLHYKELFHQFIAPNGLLFISGLLRRDESSVLASYQRSGYTLISKNAQKEWLILVLKPPKKEDIDESGY